jgi:uncharacterized protein (DUF433 family)
MARDRGKTVHASFRFSSGLLEALHARADESGATMTALVERYVSEGLRRDAHPLIVFRDGAGGRRPALAGTRLDVAQVMETVRASDKSIPDAAEYLSIPEAWVTACVRYYADHREEIDEWIERAHASSEREEDAWHRTQAVLA